MIQLAKHASAGSITPEQACDLGNSLKTGKIQQNLTLSTPAASEPFLADSDSI
ncbi:hypothetical protein N9087_01340 [bacterium]|nr:hypothetical protein [bacterium]